VAVKIEIHEKKGKIRSHVPVPKTRVELDAVEDKDFIPQADVLQMEVAMAVPDSSSG
jgi:hypothetical protein